MMPQLYRAQIWSVLDRLLSAGLVIIPPTQPIHEVAPTLAERFGRIKVCNAQYLSRASRENAPLWTAERRLATAAQTTGLNRVQWAGDWSV